MTIFILLVLLGAGEFEAKTLPREWAETPVSSTAEEIELGPVEENSLFDYIEIYPQPAHNVLFVALNYSFNEPVTIELYDVLGIRVRSKVLAGPRVCIDVSALPRGVYFLYASLGQEQRVVKRVIIH